MAGAVNQLSGLGLDDKPWPVFWSGNRLAGGGGQADVTLPLPETGISIQGCAAGLLADRSQRGAGGAG